MRTSAWAASARELAASVCSSARACASTASERWTSATADKTNESTSATATAPITVR